MSTFASASFNIESWEEKPLHEKEGLPKMSRVSAIVNYQGDIEGEGRVEYLMVYREDGSADFIGMERVRGQLAGHAGSFVLRHAGTFQDGSAKSAFTVVPGSGTNDFSGLSGHGEYAAADCDVPFTMQYDLEGVDEEREVAAATPVPIPTGP